MAENVELAIRIAARDAASSVLRGLGSTARGLGGDFGRMGLDTNQAFGRISTAALGVGGVLAAGLGAAFKTATDFEHQMSGVGAVSGATADQLAALRAQAIALGRDVTLAGVSSADAAAAEEALAKGGVSVADQLGGATKGALLLASAGALDFGQAADIAANAMNTFGLSGKDLPHVADLFAGAANASTVEVSDLGLALAQGGQVAAQFHQSIEETTAVLAAFGAAGLRGSDAGTSLKTMLLQLVNPTKQARDVMAEYGLSFFDANGRMLDFAGIADQLRTHLSGLSDQQRNAALATLFGTDAIRAASILYAQGGAGVDAWVGKVDQAGSAARVGAARNDNLRGSLEQLKGSFEAAQIAAGSFIIPDVRGAVDQLTRAINAFNGLDPTIQRAIVYGAAATAGFALLGGSIIKTTQYARDLKDSIETVIGAFGRKEAAKKTLTAANETLSKSIGVTDDAMQAVGLTAFGSAADFLVFAGAAAAAAGANVELMGVIQRHVTSQQDQQRAIRDTAQAQDAMTFAVQHGYDAIRSGLPTFSSWLEAQQKQPATTDQMVAAWNGYIDDMNRAGLATTGLRRATEDLTGPLRAAGQQLGEGRQQVAAFTSFMRDGATALADGARVAGQLAGQLPGLAAGLGQSATALGTVAEKAHEASTNVNATGLALGALATGAATANAVLDATNKQLAGLASTKGELTNYLDTLQGEWDALTAAVAKQGYATDAQKARMAALAPQITYLHQAIADNATATDQATSAAVAQMQAASAAGDAATQYAAATQAATAAQSPLAAGLAATTDAMKIADLRARHLGEGLNTVPSAVAATVTLATALRAGPFLSAQGRSQFDQQGPAATGRGPGAPPPPQPVTQNFYFTVQGVGIGAQDAAQQMYAYLQPKLAAASGRSGLK